MAATFQWSESNGAGEVVTDGISHLNFGNNDSYNLNVDTYPIPRGQNSYIKYLRGKFSGTFTEISNIKFWKYSGAYVSGEEIKAAANATFATPVKTASGDAIIPTTEGGALSLNSAEGASVILDISGVSGYTGYIRLQLQTTISSPSGDVNQKTFTLGYDEI